MPTEIYFQDEESADVHFEDEECGTSYRNYKETFVDAYNFLLAVEKGHLMHPARRLELIQYLESLFPNAELTAERMINYRCFGKYGLDISEYERSIQKYGKEILQIKEQLHFLFDNGPCLIKDPMELHEDSLDCIPPSYCRKYVCLAYQNLALKKQITYPRLPYYRSL